MDCPIPSVAIFHTQNKGSGDNKPKSGLDIEEAGVANPRDDGPIWIVDDLAGRITEAMRYVTSVGANCRVFLHCQLLQAHRTERHSLNTRHLHSLVWIMRR